MFLRAGFSSQQESVAAALDSPTVQAESLQDPPLGPPRPPSVPASSISVPREPRTLFGAKTEPGKEGQAEVVNRVRWGEREHDSLRKLQSPGWRGPPEAEAGRRESGNIKDHPVPPSREEADGSHYLEGWRGSE